MTPVHGIMDPSTRCPGVDRAVRATHRCSKLLVFVDDIHFLDICVSVSVKDGIHVSDYIKSLMNSVPAIFLSIGIGIEMASGGLFCEGGSSRRRTQTAGRFAVCQMVSCTVGHQAEAEHWLRVVAGFEDALCLYHHRQQSLATEH